GGLVEFEGEVPAEDVHAVAGGRVAARADGLAQFEDDLRDVAEADRRVHAADVNHAPVLHSVQPDITGKRAGMVEVQDEIAVGLLEGGGALTEFGLLPLLPLVLAEVLHDEGPDAFDAEQPLARGVDGEAS